MRRTRAVRSLTVAFITVCSLSVARSARAQSWTQIAPAVTPAPRSGAVLVYDPVHEELLLFGGDAIDASDETWVLRGDVWSERAPSRSPAPRWAAYGFWDSARSRVVVFGGNAAGQIDRSVIWSWDGSEWSSMTPAQNPPERRDAAVAYDSARDRIVLFGGVVDGSPDVSLADTWEFDGDTWVETTPAEGPGDRGDALMGYDPVRDISVMVNGFSQTDRLRWDTWTYDGSTWTEAPNANAPRGTALEMIWDPELQKLLIAGRAETGQLKSWTFDGAVWTEHATSTIALNGGEEGSLAFDGSGGYALYLRSENQIYQGSRLQAGVWAGILPVPQPAGIDRDRGALIFDSVANEPRLFGDSLSSDGFQGWRWDGVMWRRMALEGSRRPSSTAAVAHDVARGVTVVHGAGTFELEDDTWTTPSLTTAPPSSGALAYDAERAVIVFYGGVLAFNQYADGTWTWDGTRWQQLELSASPPARGRAAMAYDQRRQKLVLFGGMEVVNGQARMAFDTWELGALGWTASQAELPPILRDLPSITYDEGRQRIVLWGKQREEARLWEYDGRSWRDVDPPPIGDSAGILGYDAAERRLLLHDEHGRTWARPSGSPPPDEEPEDEDAGSASGGGSRNDAGRADAGGAVGADGDGGSEPERRGSGGSGCVVGARHSRPSGAAAVLAVLVLWWSRRRSRAR